MAGKAPGGGLLVVEFASDPPELSPAAARAVLDMLLSARDRQAGEDQEGGPGGYPDAGASLAPPGRQVSRPVWL